MSVLYCVQLQLFLVIILQCCGNGVWSKCPPDDPSASNLIEYVSIPEENYDRNFSSISSEGKRPLGFDKAIWRYNQPDDDNPCVKISGANNRRLEVMFETHPSSRLCVKTQDSEESCSDPGTGNYYRCMTTPGNIVYLEFLCDSQCVESDVQFWYRLVLGVLPVDDPEDHWCEDRDQSEYPESLKQLPPNYDPLAENTTPRNWASKSSASVSLAVFIILFFKVKHLFI